MKLFVNGIQQLKLLYK